MDGLEELREFKAKTIAEHRAAFDLWQRVHALIEKYVTCGRGLSSEYSKALDILFIQAFKSHGSLYCSASSGIAKTLPPSHEE